MDDLPVFGDGPLTEREARAERELVLLNWLAERAGLRFHTVSVETIRVETLNPLIGARARVARCECGWQSPPCDLDDDENAETVAWSYANGHVEAVKAGPRWED